MDDQKFDDQLRSKVGEYEDASFDPAALAALHHQLGSVSVLPWYSLYRSELLVGTGLLISTLIIVWSQWILYGNNAELMNDRLTELQELQNTAAELQTENHQLRTHSPDTIRIIEIRDQSSTIYSELLYRIRLLEAANTKLLEQLNDYPEASEHVTQEPQESELSHGGQNTRASAFYTFSPRLVPRATEKESKHAQPSVKSILKQSNAQHLSAKTLRDLEGHYQKGIGIRIGPTMEISNGIYSQGKGQFKVSGGLLSDFIVSPSLSIETGAKYMTRYYEISDPNEFEKVELPEVDESLGTLKSAEMDYWVIEIPFNLRYRYPISASTHVIGGLGYSAMVYFKQVFEYEYDYSTGGDSFILSSSYETKQATFSPGTLNFSIGLSKKLKDNKFLETSLYYQQGLGGMGVENVHSNFFGMRGVYWFRIR